MDQRAPAIPFGADLPIGAVARSRRAARVGSPAAFALCLVSGAAYAASFPPLFWSWAAWLALSPLLIACASLTPVRAAVGGMGWMVAMAAGAAWCLPAMLSGYFGLATITSWAASAAIVLLNGAYVAAYCAWVAWLARRRAADPVLLAGGWLACEFARAHGGLPSPWALTAYSQLDATPLIQIADLAGPYGIGMLIGGVNACVAALIAPALRGPRPLRAAAAIAAALAGTLLYGEWRLDQAFGDGREVRVAVVQGGAPSEKAGRAERLARHVALTEQAVAARPELIVWPEYAIEAYLEEGTTVRDTVLRTAGAAAADLILGGPHFEASSSGTRYHNSAYLVRDGRVAARYDKQRLVPVAEDGRLAWLFGERATRYARGAGPTLLAATSLRAGALLCLEAMFPEIARRAAREGADVLVNLSNDAWFGHFAPARQQLDIAALRAVENRRYLIRAASTGYSAVIDPHGRVVARSEFGTHQTIESTVRVSHATTPYQRRGDALAWTVVAAVAGASLRSIFDRSHNQQEVS